MQQIIFFPKDTTIFFSGLQLFLGPFCLLFCVIRCCLTFPSNLQPVWMQNNKSLVLFFRVFLQIVDQSLFFNCLSVASYDFLA